MTEVYITSDNIVSPLGTTTRANFEKLVQNATGIQLHNKEAYCGQPFYASLFDEASYPDAPGFTKFEQLLIASISGALEQCKISTSDKATLLIISSTKGNISLLESAMLSDEMKQRLPLHASARLVARHFGFVNQPLVISSACISGISALLTGMRLIQAGQYEHVVVAGADIISKFVLSGFQSFQAISQQPCKPFDGARNGITLGEGAATVILSARPSGHIKICGGAVSNDANHISGPSRTGEELSSAINKALHQAGLALGTIDFISAHGTATIYNDEMEAKAITLSKLQAVPVNSLKGYYGHTLGAAGLIESIISMQSLKEGLLLPTRGFQQLGVSVPINVQNCLESATVNTCLKTASGFGGCNAAVIFSKS